jgi:hypothetical protein
VNRLANQLVPQNSSQIFLTERLYAYPSSPIRTSDEEAASSTEAEISGSAEETLSGGCNPGHEMIDNMAGKPQKRIVLFAKETLNH